MVERDRLGKGTLSTCRKAGLLENNAVKRQVRVKYAHGPSLHDPRLGLIVSHNSSIIIIRPIS